MKTEYTTTLAELLKLAKITTDEHSTLARMIGGDYVSSLYGESGDRGVFFPANKSEACFARFWTDEQYTWEEMVDDIDDFGEASAILSAAEYTYWSSAEEIGEEDSARDVLRKRLYAADSPHNEGTKQAACDAVEFCALSGTALDAALAIDSDDEEALKAMLEDEDEDESE